jgi:LmbE family N-acetylglucosaminyl deacetylase
VSLALSESLPFAPRRALAIGAHPDDAEFFAGGTLTLLREAGAEVALVVCSDGGRGGRGLEDAARVRRGEQERAARALELAELVWLGHPDGELQPGEPLRGELVRELRRLRPELVLAHDPRTLWRTVGGIAQPGHSDHRAAAQAALDAIYPRAPSPHFAPEDAKPWYPREVWLFDTERPDVRIDVSKHFERKLEALRAHASQDGPRGSLVAAARSHGAALGSADRPAEGFVRLRLW